MYVEDVVFWVVVSGWDEEDLQYGEYKYWCELGQVGFGGQCELVEVEEFGGDDCGGGVVDQECFDVVVGMCDVFVVGFREFEVFVGV